MYNWVYFIITYWLRRWKDNATKVSSELFSNARLDFAIVPLLGVFFNQNVCSAFFPIIFSVDILKYMNCVNWLYLHFENISIVSFGTETSLISFQYSANFVHYTSLFPEVILSWPLHLIGWHHLLPSDYLVPFFHFIFYFLLLC